MVTRISFSGAGTGSVRGDANHDIAYATDTSLLSAFYVQTPATRPMTATVRFVGTTSNIAALGARVRIEGDGTRWLTVYNMQGFQSQNAAWNVLSLSGASSATVTVEWPAGGTSSTVVHVGVVARSSSNADRGRNLPESPSSSPSARSFRIELRLPSMTGHASPRR